MAGILADFNLTYGVLISLLPVSAGAWRAAQGLFWGQVRREWIEI